MCSNHVASKHPPRLFQLCCLQANSYLAVKMYHAKTTALVPVRLYVHYHALDKVIGLAATLTRMITSYFLADSAMYCQELSWRAWHALMLWAWSVPKVNLLRLCSITDTDHKYILVATDRYYSSVLIPYLLVLYIWAFLQLFGELHLDHVVNVDDLYCTVSRIVHMC